MSVIERTNAETLTTYTVMNALVSGVVFGTLRYLIQPELAGWHFLHELILFGVLAYGLQPLCGILIDHAEYKHHAVRLGILMVACGLLFPSEFTKIIPLHLGTVIKMILLGVGYCVFRTSASATVLRRSRHKNADIGIFLSSGVIGTAMYLVKPKWAYVMIPLMMFIAAARDSGLEFGLKQAAENPKKYHFSGVAGILFALFLMAGSFFFSFSTETLTSIRQESKLMILVMTFAVFAGRIAGGWLLDHIGTALTACISVPFGLLLLVSGGGMRTAAGLFLLNLALPGVYRLMYEIVPDAPGFAAGLMSFAAFPAVVLAARIPIPAGVTKTLVLGGAAVVIAVFIALAWHMRDLRIPRILNALRKKAVKHNNETDE